MNGLCEAQCAQFRQTNGWTVFFCVVVAISSLFRISPTVAEDAAAETQTAGDLRETVESVVSQLGAASRAERVAAEQRLLDLGVEALDWLPPPDLVEDVAASTALRRIRTELEQQAAERAVQPSRVTLVGAYSPGEALEELVRQTGNRIVFEGVDPEVLELPVELRVRDEPFWAVIAALAAKWDLHVATDPDEPRVVLRPRNETERSLAATAAGAFLVELTGLSRRGRVLAAQFAVTAEPRLRMLFLSHAAADFQAQVSPETRLRPFTPDAQRELPAAGHGPLEFAVLFQWPQTTDAQPQATLDLRGRVTVTAAALPREIRFRDVLAERVSRRRGGVTVTLAEARFTTSRRGERRAEFDVEVIYDATGPAFESHRTWVYHNEVSLETTDGERIPVNDGLYVLAEQDGGVSVRYRFTGLPDVPPEQLDLIYVAPTAVIEAPLEFEFPEIPLSDPDG